MLVSVRIQQGIGKALAIFNVAHELQVVEGQQSLGALSVGDTVK